MGGLGESSWVVGQSGSVGVIGEVSTMSQNGYALLVSCFIVACSCVCINRRQTRLDETRQDFRELAPVKIP